MEEFPEPADECFLSAEMGKVKAYHEHDAVWIAGYGQRVGLRYSEAIRLFNWLSRHHAFLLDRAKNYYECRECGSMHHQKVQICPMLPGLDGLRSQE
jgi:hypothetical protein